MWKRGNLNCILPNPSVRCIFLKGMAWIRFCPGSSTLQHCGENDEEGLPCYSATDQWGISAELCRNSSSNETFWFHDTAFLPKAFWHFNHATLQPSVACNSSQTALLHLGLFFRRWQNAFHESQRLGNDCCLKKMLLDFFKLGKNIFILCWQR